MWGLLLLILGVQFASFLHANDELQTQEVSSPLTQDLQAQEAARVAKELETSEAPELTKEKHPHDKHDSHHDKKGFNILLRYGQHSNFWDEVDDLKGSEQPETQAQRFIDKENYGAIEGIGKAKFELLGHNRDYFTDYFDTTGIGVDVNTLAGGEVYNRISPKLRGYLVWDFSFFANLRRKDVACGESGWTWLVGSNFGIGRQKLVEGEAVEFLIHTPIKESTLFYLGADLELGYKSQFSENIRFTYKGMLLPTYFYSEFDDPKYVYGVKNSSTTFRWRTEFEQTYAFQPPKEGGAEIGAQLIGGQQPTPVRILPRVWDSIHQIDAFPSYGTLFGIGGVGRIYTNSRNFGLNGYGGYYGGYFGGGASLNIYGFSVEGGSFGYEQTSKFNLRESRVLYASLGFNHVW